MQSNIGVGVICRSCIFGNHSGSCWIFVVLRKKSEEMHNLKHSSVICCDSKVHCSCFCKVNI